VAQPSQAGSGAAGDPNALLQTAIQTHQAGERARARSLYERVLTMAPRHPVALQMLAAVEYLDGNDVRAEAYRDTALTSYREAVEQYPDATPPRAGYVNLLLAAGRVREAEQHAPHLALDLNPYRHTVAEFNRRRHAAHDAGHPPICINTIPKSASESIWNRLADRLDMAQCHVSIGLFPNCTAVPFRVAELGAGGICTKEHLAPTAFNVQTLVQSGVTRIVLHLRDPRQVALSWAHFVRDDVSATPLGPLWRDTCPPASVLNGDFAGLLDWCVDHYLPLVVDFIRGWQAIDADPASGLSVLFTTFESFVADPEAYLSSVLSFYGLDAGDAAATASEDVHLRSGRTEEWRSVLSSEQQRRARATIGADILDAFAWPR